MVPWSHLRQPCLGWLLAVLTSEFTHFNLVIRLNNAKQLAFRFFTVFRKFPRLLWPQGFLATALLRLWSRAEQSETPFLLQLQLLKNCYNSKAGSCLQVWWLFLLMVVWWGQTFCAPNSLELVQLFYALGLTWLPTRQGNNARHLGTVELSPCLGNCFGCFTLVTN